MDEQIAKGGSGYARLEQMDAAQMTLDATSRAEGKDLGPDMPYGPSQKPWKETVSPLAMSDDGKLLVSPPSYGPATCTYAKSLYQIPSTGLSKQEQSLAYDEIMAIVEKTSKNFLGFQGNFNHKDFSAINPFVDGNVFVINAGNPFVARHSHTSIQMEQNVLDYYASLWNAKWPHDPNDPESYWGYVLNMGSTEGTMQAIWNARNYLCGRITKGDALQPGNSFTSADIVPTCPQGNPNTFSPVVFCSSATHPSVEKILDMLQVPTFYELGQCKYSDDNPLSPGKPWPSSVPTNIDGDRLLGTINIDVLATLVDFFSAKGHPIIVILNYGTTFEGAFDDVKIVGEAIIPILKKNNMYSYKICYESEDSNLSTTRHGFWFHVDGALGASYMPFVEMAHKKGLLPDEVPGPVFDFRLDFVSSIVFSGYKWVGTTWPCGVYISKTSFLRVDTGSKNYLKLVNEITVSGSRNGLSAMLLWTKCCSNSYDKEVMAVVLCLKLAQYAEKKLKELEEELKMSLWVSRADTSLAVVFKKPNNSIVKKYSLLSLDITVNGEDRCYVHIYIMPSVPKDRVDALVEDLRSKDAFIS